MNNNSPIPMIYWFCCSCWNFARFIWIYMNSFLLSFSLSGRLSQAYWGPPEILPNPTKTIRAFQLPPRSSHMTRIDMVLFTTPTITLDWSGYSFSQTARKPSRKPSKWKFTGKQTYLWMQYVKRFEIYITTEAPFKVTDLQTLFIDILVTRVITKQNHI